MKDDIKPIILVATIIWILLLSGCKSGYSWVESGSGAAAHRSRLNAKYWQGTPTELKSWHQLQRNEITQKEYNEHQWLRGQDETSLAPGSYGMKIPKAVEYDSFGEFLLNAFLPMSP